MKNIFGLFHSLVFTIIVIFLFTSSNLLHAQWIQTNGPGGAISVNSIIVSGTDLFAGTYSGGVFLSTNNGTSWTEVNNGLTTLSVYVLALSGTNLFAGTNAGVFLSTNNGSSWTAVNNGLTSNYVSDLAVSSSYLFAGTTEGVFLSTNNGTSWTAVNNGLTKKNVNALEVSNSYLFAGTTEGVFLSTNNGTSWTAVNTGLPLVLIFDLIVYPGVRGSNIFAGTYAPEGGVYLSTNNGTTWTAVNTGLPSTYISSFIFSGTNLFVGTFTDGVFLSTNNGTSWTDVNNGLTNSFITSLAVFGSNIFSGSSGAIVWRRPLSEIISVELLSTEVPDHYQLDQNYPNPFNPSTTISFSLPSRSFVSLKIFDALGKEVSTLVNEKQNVGSYSVTFDGSNLQSGIYFYKLNVNGGQIETKRMMLIK